MSEELKHFGIKGMRWGVRRSPEQLGHAVAQKPVSALIKKRAKFDKKKTPGKAFRKSTSISDEELSNRIKRLNMEEQYEQLLARKNAREKTGAGAWAKAQVVKSLKSFGEKTLDWAVGKAVDKATGKKFYIDKYKDMDVNDMDSDTIAKVSKWWTDALKIDAGRSKLNSSKPSA